MGDPHRLRQHFERIGIATGIERVAAVVARRHRPDVARGEFVQQGYARQRGMRPPARSIR